ncbi:IPT/TIG domain-containing protein [Nocardia sp. CA-129566]|uniref:IPT/TIG domain-containing protein n=1 Tax=Nocardia sp. CA-129566 TaxID=3239976 RepID=UPI003D95AA73
MQNYHCWRITGYSGVATTVDTCFRLTLSLFGDGPMAPVLTSLNPNFGPASGGNTVEIFGSGFAGKILTVRFGATATTFTVVSDTQLNAIAPPGTGTVNVTVQDSLDGTSNALLYTYGGTGLLYLTDGLVIGHVYSMPQTGGAPTLLASGLNFPIGLIRIGNLLYICETGANRVSTVPITGGAPTPLVTGLAGPTGITVSGNTLFIANQNNNTLVSAPITGTATPTLVATIPTGAFGDTA